ncbi:MAG: hypothetical protein C4575_13080 [Desulforudis sp.]|jgi:PRTRC genetic system protein A|nr:MAG: hypothetical protein C4575_13080 [Desulforudis sp.]
MITHHIAHSLPLPALPPGLYQYVLAGNGVFIRAERPGLSACIGYAAINIRGLSVLEPSVVLQTKVPYGFVLDMLDFSRQAAPNEILFYLLYDAGQQFFLPWRLVIPNQVQSPSSVHPVDPYNPHGQEALIECHSHHNMGAFFSSTDDKDETGFRIYAVLGEISTRPVLAVRVGIYGHFYPIPAHWVFDLPADAEVEDVLYRNISMEIDHYDHYNSSLD